LTTIELETKRTYLRNLILDDAEDFYRLNLDPDVLKYTGDAPFQRVDDARMFLEHYDQYEKYGVGRLAVIEKGTNAFIGWCGLKYSSDIDEYDIGFRFFKDVWNQEYASETVSRCLEFGFSDLDIEEIVGRAMMENKASIQVLEKIGMIFKQHFDFDGQDGVIYQMTKSEYHKMCPTKRT